MQDVSLLLEALPFVNRYKGKTFVLKLGGEVVQSPENLDMLSQDVCFLNKVGIRVLLVHGGGPQANELSERLGLTPNFIDGRRITDRAALEVTKMVFAGQINTDILSCIRRHGGHAVGLSGVDASVLLARRRPKRKMKDPDTGHESEIDFGHVGDIVSVDSTLLRILLDHDYIPVLSSLGADQAGHVFNINADTVATEIAKSLEADKLLMLTNVAGVMRSRAKGDVIPRLTPKEAHGLMKDGTVTKGMLPKLTSAVEAVERGVKRCTVLSGLTPHALLEETFTDRGSGTLIEATPPRKRATKATKSTGAAPRKRARKTR